MCRLHKDIDLVTQMRAKRLNWAGHLVRMFDNRITKEIWKEVSGGEIPLKSRGKAGQVKCGRLPANCSIRNIGAQRKDIGVTGGGR